MFIIKYETRLKKLLQYLICNKRNIDNVIKEIILTILQI